MVKNIFQNIFSNFLIKYFQKIFLIPKCYTFLESWDHMPTYGFDKNLIWRKKKFNIQRGDPLDLQKRFLQCRGVILHEKKFCKTRSSSNMSKNALLSASGWNPKLHNYHPCLTLQTYFQLIFDCLSIISIMNKQEWRTIIELMIYLLLSSKLRLGNLIASNSDG